MGYRSEVVLAVSSKALPVLMHVLSKTPGAWDFCFQGHDTMKKDYDGQEGAILFHWEWVKWYVDYPEVAAINSFLARMQDLECEDWEEWGEEYRFVRMGDEDGDQDILGSGWADVCVSRGIQF